MTSSVVVYFFYFLASDFKVRFIYIYTEKGLGFLQFHLDGEHKFIHSTINGSEDLL